MNNRLSHSIRTIGLGLVFSMSSLAWAAAPSPSTCGGLLSMQATYKNCQANGATIRQCIQNNLASQISGNSGSISSQLQATSSASQTLAQLDFQCQYFLAYGSQPPISASGPNSNGGFGSNLKKMLGLQPQSAAPGATASTSNQLAQSNQATQLNSIKPVAPPAKKANSNQDDNNSNSINWF